MLKSRCYWMEGDVIKEKYLCTDMKDPVGQLVKKKFAAFYFN